jgi:hypothetical protein
MAFNIWRKFEIKINHSKWLHIIKLCIWRLLIYKYSTKYKMVQTSYKANRSEIRWVFRFPLGLELTFLPSSKHLLQVDIIFETLILTNMTLITKLRDLTVFSDMCTFSHKSIFLQNSNQAVHNVRNYLTNSSLRYECKNCNFWAGVIMLIYFGRHIFQ